MNPYCDLLPRKRTFSDFGSDYYNDVNDCLPSSPPASFLRNFELRQLEAQKYDEDDNDVSRNNDEECVNFDKMIRIDSISHMESLALTSQDVSLRTIYFEREWNSRSNDNKPKQTKTNKDNNGCQSTNLKDTNSQVISIEPLDLHRSTPSYFAALPDISTTQSNDQQLQDQEPIISVVGDQVETAGLQSCHKENRVRTSRGDGEEHQHYGKLTHSCRPSNDFTFMRRRESEEFIDQSANVDSSNYKQSKGSADEGEGKMVGDAADDATQLHFGSLTDGMSTIMSDLH